MKRILLADSDRDLRSALGLLLQTRLGVQVMGEASSMPELFLQIVQVCPDLIVLDWDLPGEPRVDRIKLLKADAPNAKVVVLSVRTEVAAQAQAAKADGFINKADPPDLILQVFQQALNHHV